MSSTMFTLLSQFRNSSLALPRMSIPHHQWIVSAAFDMAFFSTFWLPPILGLLYFASLKAGMSGLLFSVVVYHLFLRLPHFAATAGITFGLKGNASYYMKHWVWYLAIPALILVAYTLPVALNVDPHSPYRVVLEAISYSWGI